MKVKLIKKSVSLLLVLCMVLSLAPMNVFAATGTNDSFGAAEGFYKVVHLDAGRKYISVENVKKYIDAMADVGYNQLTLYFSDNQGFRFKLDDMTLNVNGTDYTTRFESTIGNGYNQPADGVGTGDWFRSSLEPDGTKNYYTEADMKEIISYANSKGIDLVPAFDMPGHMGAILEVFTEFRYTGSSATSWSSLDVDNETARAFALAILQKYVDFFKEAGCDYFSICADEFCYDTGSGNIKTDTLANIMLFMDEAAKIIDNAGMVPRCFNDWLYSSNAYTPSEAYGKYEVYYWGNRGYATPDDLIAEGHKIINTGEAAYYALGSGYYTEADTDAGVKAFDPYVIATKAGSFEISNPAGACFAIWCDRGYFDDQVANTANEPEGGDGGTILFQETEGYLRLFAASVDERGPQEVTVELKIGEEYDQVFGPYTGELTAADIANELGLEGYVTASSISVTPGTPAIPGTPGGDVDTTSALTALTAGTKVILGDGTNFLVDNNGTLTVGTLDNATQWDVVAKDASFNFVSGDKYLYVNTAAVSSDYASLSDTAPDVPFQLVDGVVKQAWWPSNAVSVSGVSSVKAYGVSAGTPDTPAVPGSTTFKLTGASVGTETFTYGGADYTINVVSGEHTCDSNVPATCVKGASCSQCGKEMSTATDPSNHAGPMSTANCANPATCSACSSTVGGTDPDVHTGRTLRKNEVAATETTKGYSGDVYCADCDALLEQGHETDMVHTHTGGVATCVSKAICTSCGEAYGEVDPSYHAGDLVVKGISKYYAGSLFCADCGEWVRDQEGDAASTGYNESTMILVEVPANGTASHTVDGELVANGTTGNTDKGLASYTVSVATTTVGATGTGEYTAFDPTTLAVGESKEVVFQAGTTTNYLKSDGYNTTNVAEAGKWTITRVDGGYTISCNGAYISTAAGGNIAGLLSGNESSVFQWDGSCFYYTAGAYNYYLYANNDPSWWVWYGPVNYGTPMAEVTTGGTGESKTTTTVTFTAGDTNGYDTVTIGGQTFFVLISGGKDPVIEGVDCEHEWVLKYDDNGHWYLCEKCGSGRGKEDHTGGTATCQNKAVCSVCEQTYGELADHDYSDATCQTLATCSVCGTTTGDYAPHAGGIATCQNKAVCATCGNEYGELNPHNHAGPMEEIEGTYVAPTDETDGKEADTYCTACETTVEGAVIPSLNSNVVEITVAVGGTYDILISGKDATSAIVQGNQGIASASGVFVPGMDDKPEVAPQPVTSITLGGTYVFSDGDSHYLATGTPPSDTTDGLAAVEWTITQDETTGLYYIQNSDGNYLLVRDNDGTLYVANEINNAGWNFNSETMAFTADRKSNTGAQVTYTLSFNGTTWAPVVGGTPAKLCIPGTPFEAGYPSKTTVTISGVTEGVTYITVDGTRYKVNVVDAALLNAVLATPTWTTNRKVMNFQDENGNAVSFYEKITAADHVGLISDSGVALADLLPARGETDTENQGETASEVVYWRAMRHTAQNAQGKNTDCHQIGDVINYVRYDRESDVWYGSADQTNWLDLTGYTLDVYYLQETAVTKEVITEVVDWGLDYDDAAKMWESSTFVLLDFAVALDGVGRHPVLSGFPNPGDGTTVANQKTIAFHCTHGDDEKTGQIGTNWSRRVDTIFAKETMEYEVYMITVTPSNDTPTVKLPINGTTMHPHNVTNFTYDGTEKIIWTIDEDTFNEKYGQVTTDGKTLGALDTRPENFDITSESHKMTMYRTVGGDPIVDYVQIYENQGLLVTYYVRAKATEDALHVHYRLEGTEDDLHMYYIAVQEGTFFNPGFNDDVTNTETGLVNNTVTNFYGNTHTVTSDLTDLFDVPAEYRTGMYQFNQHIDFVLEDGTKVNQEDYTEDMGKIKEVILYYGLDNTHFVPVDFGHHLTIDTDFFKHHVDEHFKIESISVQPSPMTGYFHKYGNLTPYDGDGDGVAESYGYMPYYILDDHEDAYAFTLNMTDTDGNSVSEVHHVVFFPATTVYYEEFFLYRETAVGATISGNWQMVQDGNNVTFSTLDKETDHQQDICHADTASIYNYGRDDGINRENGPSNGTEMVAVDNSAYAEFEITGTGVEIYANSTLNTSNAAVIIYSGTGDAKTLYKMFIVDTRLKEDVDENGNNIATDATNKVEDLGNAYNVPVVTVTDMPYGTYTVRIGYVTGSEARGDGFRFDGFRVLEPLQNDYALPSSDGLTAGYVYNEHAELNPTFFELRDAVIAQASIPADYEGDYADQIAADVIHQVSAASNSVKAVIIGSTANPLDTSNQDVLVDMLDNAAKNEIYLWPGQAIVFKVSDAYHLQVGMRAVNQSVNAKYYVASENGVPTETTRLINTTTDMFYPMTYGGNVTTALTGDTVVITNASTEQNAVLSITMLKCLPDQLNSGDLLLELNENDYTLALTALGYEETPKEDVPEETVPEETEPEETEPEETEPEETEPEVTQPDVEFIGASLSLKGDIGLNFYVKLSDKILADETAYMQFTVGGTTRTVALSEGILDESDGSYRFSVALNAKNMGDAVTAQVYNEDGAVGASKTLSIKDYADYAIKNSNKGQLVKLMKAMLNYGAAAQIEFGYNLDNLVNADLDDADKTQDGTVDVGAFQHSITGSEDGIHVTSASLLLQSETKIRIYFTLDEGKSIDDYTFTIDGETVTPVKAANGEYYLEKANIAAKDLDSVYTFCMGGLTLTYSGMSYINQVQTHSGNDVNLMKLAKTLYEYCQAANVYFG